MFLLYAGIIIRSLLPAEEHAFYLGLVEIEVSSEGTQVVIKTFTDDFLDVMKNYNDEHQRDESDLSEGNRLIVEAYFNEKMIVGESSLLTLKKAEIQNDSYWLTFENTGTMPSTFNITADFFMELFPAQQNVVITTWEDQKRSCRLALASPSCEVEF